MPDTPANQAEYPQHNAKKRSIGFRAEYLFVNYHRTNPPMRHGHQEHARKNHSFSWVFRTFRKPKT